MRILLDTVTFIWALRSPDLISRPAFSTLESESVIREISSISISEIGIKHSIGKLSLSKADVMEGIEDLKLRVLPYLEKHAYWLFDLPRHHADPFDRQIIAQGLAEGIPVVTPDPKFGSYQGLKTLW